MAILNLLSVAQAPTGPWPWIVLNLFSFVEDYGWRMVVFTIILKLLLSPLDIYQRYKGRKNQKIAQRIKPQMEKLQKIYGNDPQTLSRKQMELNKKEGMSMFSSCLPAIVTLIIFITLFSTGLNPISQYQNFREYQLLYDKYTEVYSVEVDKVRQDNYDAFKAQAESEVTEEERTAISEKAVDNVKKAVGEDVFNEITHKSEIETEKTVLYNQFIESKVDSKVLNAANTDEHKEGARQAVKDYYEDEVRTGFLWVKNIWNADTPFTAPINGLDAFKKNIGDYADDYEKAGYSSSEELTKMLSSYDDVMHKLINDSDYNKANGYMIFPILTVLLSITMQIVSYKQQKNSGQMNAQNEMSMKVMMFVMPVMMGFFAFSYTAAFSIYLVVNYVISLLISLVSALILGFIDKKDAKNQVTKVQTYGRPDFSDRKDDDK